MLDFILYLLLPTLVPLVLLYIFGIRRFGLEKRVAKLAPTLFTLAVATDILGEIGVYFLKPWRFDCSKTLGICPGGIPIEDLLVAFLIWGDVALATLAFMEIKRMSKSRLEFLEYLLLLKNPKGRKN